MRAALALLLIVLATSARAEVITYHLGGRGWEANRLSTTSNLIVDGICNSACAWGWVWNSKACFTDKAKFYFHTPRNPDTKKINAKVTKLFLKRSPKWVKLEGRYSAKELKKLAPERYCSG